MIILGFDGLEYEYVKKFNLKGLKQLTFGKTNLSEFSQMRTIVLWSSFITGRNMEKEIPLKDQWKFRVKVQETFFKNFKRWKAIDVPGFTYKFKIHEKERRALKLFFKKEITVEEYDKIAFENYKKIKEEYLRSLRGNYDLIMGYFAIADVVGHLSFGITSKMKLIYKELEDIVETTKQKRGNETILIISDHGMKAIGRFGDHSNYGFWSLNRKVKLRRPRITEFRGLIESLVKEGLNQSH